MELTVGQVAELAKISVRTLHHYDEIGLLRPSARSRVGYRLYDDHDLDRMQQIMLYRGLSFSLEDMAAVLDDPTVSTTAHLRRQLRLIAQRMDQLTDLRAAVLRQLEAYSMNIKLTRAGRGHAVRRARREASGDGSRRRRPPADHPLVL